MVKIENEYGVFEADSEAEALKASRKAARAAKAAYKKKEKLRDKAADLAKLSAFKYLSKIVAGESAAKAWIVYPPSSPYSAKSNLNRITGGNVLGFKSYSTERSKSSIDCESGEYETYWENLIGTVIDGSCSHRLIFTKDTSTGEVRCYAVGVYGGVVHLELLEGVSPDYFNVSDKYGKISA